MLLMRAGRLDDFEPLRAMLNKRKDFFGFPYAEIDRIEWFRIKSSERQTLLYEQIEDMMEALKPIDN